MSENFTIQISPRLVDRLIGYDDQSKKKTKPQKPQTKEPQKLRSDGVETHAVAPVLPLQPPLFIPVPPTPVQVANAELDAIRSVLKESEKVVERLQKQEENMAQELTQRAKELHDKEFKLPYQNPMPCVAEREACLECYKEHSKDPLKCGNVVKSFADCARNMRQQMNTVS